MGLALTAFDIETTGFAASDEVTVMGFAVPLGVRVFAQTGGRPERDVAATVADRVDAHVTVSTHESERAVFEAVASFVADRFRDEDVLLVAFNGEVWGGGFDLPFLRTRYARRDEDWPFREVPYADLYPVLTKRFNTTLSEDGEAHSDLASVYDVLCDGSYGDVDPFEDSAAAVSAFHDGQISDLVTHNAADVLRTRALGRLAERYCSKSDFQVKSLTPTTHA